MRGGVTDTGRRYCHGEALVTRGGVVDAGGGVGIEVSLGTTITQFLLLLPSVLLNQPLTAWCEVSGHRQRLLHISVGLQATADSTSCTLSGCCALACTRPAVEN